MDKLEQVVACVRGRRELPPPAHRRAIRRRAGLSQADVAELIGVSRAAVARWELGQRRPRLRYASRYAEVLERLDEAAAR